MHDNGYQLHSILTGGRRYQVVSRRRGISRFYTCDGVFVIITVQRIRVCIVTPEELVGIS